MLSELLRAFSCEFYAITQDRSSSNQLTNHTLNSATHYRPDITVEVFELRDAATKTGMLLFINLSNCDFFSSVYELQQLLLPVQILMLP